MSVNSFDIIMNYCISPFDGLCLAVIKTGIDDQEVTMHSQQGALVGRLGHDGGREEELCPVTVVVTRCNSGIICHA